MSLSQAGRGVCPVLVHPTYKSSTGRVAQWSKRSAWYPKVLGSNPAISTKHVTGLLHGWCMKLNLPSHVVNRGNWCDWGMCGSAASASVAASFVASFRAALLLARRSSKALNHAGRCQGAGIMAGAWAGGRTGQGWVLRQE
jgi:hypothetical protein